MKETDNERERECFTRVGRGRADYWWSGVCREQRILD